MRDTALCRWQRWRVTVVTRPTTDQTIDRYSRRVLSARTAPAAGPDGIRHDLVARVRAEIEAGTYDCEERWLKAEEALLRRML